MKKIKQIFNYLFFTLLIYSCTPNENISFDNDENKILQEMKSIQKDYENKINTNSNLRISKKDKFNKIKPEWDYFWQQEFKGQKDKVIIVPYNAIPNEDYKTKLEDGTMLSYDDATFLKVTKNKGKYEYEVITKIPDGRYLENDGSVNNSFTGSIFIYDLFGEFIKGYKVTLNQVVDLNIKIDNYGNFKSVRIKNDPEYCVDWYTCVTTDSGISWNCNYNYTECTVGGTISGSYNSSYGIIGAINYGGDGGTATNNATSNNFSMLPLFNLCPPAHWQYSSTDYKTTITGLGLTAIGIKGYLINVELGKNCITIPKSKAGTTYAAAEIFAGVFNLARAEVERDLESAYIVPTQAAIRTDLIKRIRENLNFLGLPSSSFGLNDCGGTVPISIANYGC